MGVYRIKCPGCEREHAWFSGSMDQRCDECKIPVPTTPSEIVNVMGNIANRPDINAAKRVQLKAINTLLKNQLTEIKTLVEKELKPTIEYLTTSYGNCTHCDPSVGFHTPECCIERGMKKLLSDLDEAERKLNGTLSPG